MQDVVAPCPHTKSDATEEKKQNPFMYRRSDLARLTAQGLFEVVLCALRSRSKVGLCAIII